MKQIALVVAANLPSLACVGVSGALALHGMEGWGWFLFGAVLLHTTYSFSSRDKPNQSGTPA